MFARDGFDSVTVEQITEAADVSAMTFYRHFGSKEAVVTSVATTDQMNHAIGALDRIRIPGEIPDVLDDFFADAASWEAELAERVALVRANQTLVNALWQRSTSWTDAISEVLGPGLDSRIYARVLVGPSLRRCSPGQTHQSSHQALRCGNSSKRPCPAS